MEILVDSWLSGIFGYPVFRVQGSVVTPEGVRKLREHVAGADKAFGYAKIGSERVGDVRALTGEGFVVVDMAVTLDLVRASEESSPSGVQVTESVPGDEADLVRIAGSAFRFSRFHLDSLVPVGVADRVKEEWVRSCLAGRRGDCLYVARSEERPVGFLAVLTADSGARRIQVIDLMGVDRAHQRKGAGRALVSRFVRDRRDKADVLRVGTQGANTPSIRFYENQGFRTSETQFVLHLHVERGAARA